MSHDQEVFRSDANYARELLDALPAIAAPAARRRSHLGLV
jgi:hypothetical protein